MPPITLRPVDAVSITIVVDNVTDLLVGNQGPAQRPGASGGSPPIVAAPLIAGGRAFDAPLAEHGFAALVTVRQGEQAHHLLFDAGATQDGLVENMRRLNLQPKEIETIVLSHGHPDHVMGLHGLVRALGGRAHLPGPLTEGTRATCQALAAIAPTVIVPTHCTGFPAMALLAAELPNAFIQSTVGTRFAL